MKDWHGWRWRSDDARIEFLRPYLMRQEGLALANRHAPSTVYGFAVADLVCRVFAPHVLDRRWPEHAAKLRVLGMVVDRDTAEEARRTADAVWAAVVAVAADGVVDDAVWVAAAATDVADAVDDAVWAVGATADAADDAATTNADDDAYLKMAGQLLTRLLDVCEAGGWPLPGE